MQIRLDHLALNMKNEAEMIHFYHTVLQLPAERLGEYRQGKVPFASVRIDADTIIDLFPRALWASIEASEGITNLNHFCLSLEKDGWHTLCDRLASFGIPIEEGPVSRWGAHGNGTSVYFRDPDANRIEARYYD
ncbi:MAG: VOC family protein [Deltaproteobacteria bacterium]|nr:VOC family protein [Deltaproteobacteria bacterium]